MEWWFQVVGAQLHPVAVLSCRSLLAEREGIKRSVVLPGVKVRTLGERVAGTASQLESRAIPGVLWYALLR